MKSISRVLRTVLKSESADAAVCMDCESLNGRNYKCEGNYMWVRDWQKYGCRCQFTKYGPWRRTNAICGKEW